MDDLICTICYASIQSGQRRISWFNKDENNNTTERGAIHLSHIGETPGVWKL